MLRLVEDESALLEITENLIRKNLYFKHDEEFSKENKDKAKDNPLKKTKQDKTDSSNTLLKKASKSLNIGKEKEEIKSSDIEMLDSDSAINPIEKGISGQKQKHTDQSEGTVLKKENISFHTFKNCSGVRLNQFLEQMSFLESRAHSVFLKACSNLGELENVKEYDTEMKVKSEYKIIKLKDSVLKDYISKTSKEGVQVIKNSISQSSKKNLGIASSLKSGSQTARVKGAASSSLPSQSK